MKKVALVLGSDSDLPVAEKAFNVLSNFEIEWTVQIMSAHRTPDITAEFAKNARRNGYGVIVAFAGMAAHLAGAIAAQTTLPVIAVPCSGGALGGLDALLSTVQMPSGIPVAVVALDGGANAAYLSAQILAVSEEVIAHRLVNYRIGMLAGINEKNKELSGFIARGKNAAV